jgi:hypothetical protein
MGCTAYNPHSQECCWCESRKPPNLICRHTDELQFKKKYLETRFRAKMFHPDQRPGVMSIPVAYDDEWNRMEKYEETLKNSGAVSKLEEGNEGR